MLIQSPLVCSVQKHRLSIWLVNVPDAYRHLHYLIFFPKFSAVIPSCSGPVDKKDTFSASLSCTWIPSSAHLLTLRVRHSKVNPQAPQALQEKNIRRILPDTCGRERIVYLRDSPPTWVHVLPDLYMLTWCQSQLLASVNNKTKSERCVWVRGASLNNL